MAAAHASRSHVVLNAPNASIVGAESAAPNCTQDIDARPSSAAMPAWRGGVSAASFKAVNDGVSATDESFMESVVPIAQRASGEVQAQWNPSYRRNGD